MQSAAPSKELDNLRRVFAAAEMWRYATTVQQRADASYRLARAVEAETRRRATELADRQGG